MLLGPGFHLIPVPAFSDLMGTRPSRFLEAGITWRIVCVALDVLSQGIQTMEHVACRLVCWGALVDLTDPCSKSFLRTVRH